MRTLLGFMLALIVGAGCDSDPATVESEVGEVIFVDSEMVDCVGVGPQKCLRVRSDPDDEWRFFYDTIDGFEFTPGTAYELRVVTREIPDPPEDASSQRYELVEVVEKRPVPPTDTGNE